MKLNSIFKRLVHMPKLDTARLQLRAIKRQDLNDIYEYSANPKTSQYLLWYPHKSLEETSEHINIVLSRYKSGEFNDWAIVYKSTGKMIGTCGFTSIDEDNNSVEIGYVINPDFWGIGIATEAVTKILEFAFKTLEVNRVEAKFMFGNEGSLAVMKKVGMKLEGYYRDSLFVKGRYRTIGIASILKREYDLKDKY